MDVSNPRPSPITVSKEPGEQVSSSPQAEAESRRSTLFVHALLRRAIYVPGKVVADWYRHIPADKPFLRGCGYRVIAPLFGCQYSNYAQELYPVIYPEYAAKDISGNVNAASFMYDYANFGHTGLIIAGIVLGLLMGLLERLFMGAFEIKLSLLTFPVLMLSSSALTTLVFSGGMGLMVLLFILFRDALTQQRKA